MKTLMRSTGLTLGLTLLAALFTMSVASTASASYPQRTAAVDAFQGVATDATIDAGWTGSVSGCQVGAESPASLEATLRTLNVLRTVAGLKPVTFDPGMNQEALAASLMTKASGAINHAPAASSPCWSKLGADAAGRSNLYLGLSGAAAMVGYVEDPGMESLAHRRWMLDPAAMLFGSGSTGTSNALEVTKSHGNGSRDKSLASDNLVAWPSPGWFPSPWMFPRWSIAIGAGATKVDVSKALVSATIDGSPLQVSGVSSLDEGFGTGKTIAWNTELPASSATGDHEIKVSINGVKIDGTAKPINYTVREFDPGIQVDAPDTAPTPDPPVSSSSSCKLETKRVKKATRALAKTRKRGNRSAVRKAKKKLKAHSKAWNRVCR